MFQTKIRDFEGTRIRMKEEESVLHEQLFEEPASFSEDRQEAVIPIGEYCNQRMSSMECLIVGKDGKRGLK
jgi:hypothetical protein